MPYTYLLMEFLQYVVTYLRTYKQTNTFAVGIYMYVHIQLNVCIQSNRIDFVINSSKI